MFICAYFPFSRFGIRLFVCAYFPFSRFGIRLCCTYCAYFLGLEFCLFAPIFRFLGLELDASVCSYFAFLGLELIFFVCAYFPFARFGIRFCSFVPIFNCLGLELGFLFSIFTVWN